MILVDKAGEALLLDDGEVALVPLSLVDEVDRQGFGSDLPHAKREQKFLLVIATFGKS